MLGLFASVVALSAASCAASFLPTPDDLFPRSDPDAVELVPRASSSSNFSLFAYGSATDTEIGGYPLFYYDGFAYICNPAKVNYTSDYVVFYQNSTSWIANPLTVSTAPWTESLFYIPLYFGPAGFYTEGDTNVSTTNIVTTGFKFYGSTAMLSIDGTLYTDWYAVATSVDGLWSVGWNATGGDVADAELISLRKGKAANVDFPKDRKQ